MKTIASLPVLCVLVVVSFDVACGTTLLYLRNPAFDKAEVHTERIGGSFAYKTSELLAYSPIVYRYNVPYPLPLSLPLTINYQHPFSVLVAHPNIPVDVPAESQPASKPELSPEEPIHDSVVTVDDNDTVAVEAATN